MIKTSYLCVAILIIASFVIFSQAKRYQLEIHDDKLVCQVDKRFLSVAIGTYHARQRFKAVDFTSQRLKNVVSALRPAYIRFGGSDANFLVYRPGNRLIQPTLITTQTTPTTTPTTQTNPPTTSTTTKMETTTTTTEPPSTTERTTTTTTEKPTTTKSTTTAEKPTTTKSTTTTTEKPTTTKRAITTPERPTTPKWTQPPITNPPLATQPPPVTPPPAVPVTTPPQSHLPNVGVGQSGSPAGGAPPWGAISQSQLKKGESNDKSDSEKEEERQYNKDYQVNGKYYAEDIKQSSDVQSVPETQSQYTAPYGQYSSDQPSQTSQSIAPVIPSIEENASPVDPQNGNGRDLAQQNLYSQNQSTSTLDSAVVSTDQAAWQYSSQNPQQPTAEAVSGVQQQAIGSRDASDAETVNQHQEENGNSAKRSNGEPISMSKGKRIKRSNSLFTQKRSRQDRFPFWFAANDFDRLARFVHDTGLKLIYDLNGFFRQSDGAWDATNAIDIVRHVEDEGYDIVWELGNEPNRYESFGKERILSSFQVAQDTIRLRSLLMRSKHYGSVVIGPGISRPGVSNSESFLRKFLHDAAWAIDAVTWHQYYTGRTATINDILDPQTLNVFKYQVMKINKIVAQSQTGKPVWLGETGSSWGGGILGVSNVFAASFMFLDKLGLAAFFCNQVVIRQSLIGGNYALLDDDFTPRPDYWAALIHKKLAGRKVLEVSGGDERLRVYAHCTNSRAGYPRGALTLVALNLWKKTTAKIELKGNVGKQDIDQYLVTPSNGKLSSKSVDLNGEELHILSGMYIPKLHPVHAKKPLTLPPRSYAFYVIPLANSRRCF